ncbi:uncharacterized protein ACNLHF_003209 [Anomaloglossus baeobatrachus]
MPVTFHRCDFILPTPVSCHRSSSSRESAGPETEHQHHGQRSQGQIEHLKTTARTLCRKAAIMRNLSLQMIDLSDEYCRPGLKEVGAHNYT